MHLIQKIVELKNFWPTLAKPLYHELVADARFYAYIIGIFAQQFLLSKKDLSKEFGDVVRELLDVKKGFIQKWSKYLVKISSMIVASTDIDQFDTVTYTGDIFLLYAWKLFVNYGQVFAPDYFKDPELRTIITDTCLDALVSHFEVVTEMPCIKFWSELYTMCLSEWETNSFENVSGLFSKTQKVITVLTADYKTISPSTKKAVLTAVAIMLKKFKNYADENTSIIFDMLEPLGKIVGYGFLELTNALESSHKCNTDDVPDSIPTWLLILSVANKVLLLKSVTYHAYWFEEIGFLKKVLWCVGPFIQSTKTLPFAKFAIKSLTIYSQSPLANNLLRANKNIFFKETVPPTEYVHPPLKNAPVMREWWVTYTEIIKFMNFLILKFCNAIGPDVLTFVNFHDDTIIATLELARLTADPAALNLICSLLLFCNNMLLWRGRWITNKDNYFGRTVVGSRVICLCTQIKINFNFSTQSRVVLAVYAALSCDRKV